MRYLIIALLTLTACAASDNRPYDPDDGTLISSGHAYLWLPQLLGTNVEVRDSSTALIGCYETELMRWDDELHAVSLQFELIDDQLRLRTGQWSPLFASCVESVTVTWDLSPLDLGEGEIIPIELGPIQGGDTFE